MSEEATVAPVQEAPTPVKAAGGRQLGMDVARGFAILGILFANIAAFSYPTAGAMMTLPLRPDEDWLGILIHTFVSGKFRGMLAILFGAGLAMQFSKRQFMGEQWPGTYLRRTLILLAIGIAHFLGLWFGDILTVYALMSFCLLFAPKASDETLKKLIVIFFTIGLVLGIGTTVAMTMFAEVIEKNAPNFNEMVVYQSGSYIQQFLLRLTLFANIIVEFPFLFCSLATQFLIGIWLSRNGHIADVDKDPGLWRKVFYVGIAGLVICLALAVAESFNDKIPMHFIIEMGVNTLVAPLYLYVMLKLAKGDPLSWLTRALSNVGKMALTCYILTTIICTTLFYSYGFKLFGKLSMLELVGVVLAVNTVVIIFAALWHKFKLGQGPVERLWRKLAKVDAQAT